MTIKGTDYDRKKDKRKYFSFFHLLAQKGVILYKQKKDLS